MVLKSKVRISSILFRFVVIMLTVAGAFLTIGLIGYLLKKGLPYVNRAFLFTEPDILMDSYGIKPMLINTIYTVVLTLIFCIPLGIGSAIYLAEYAKQGKIVSGIRFAIEILAGIPSIVYGLFGLIVIVPFVRDYIAPDGVGAGFGIFSTSIVLAIMILPTIISCSLDALYAVPNSYFEGALALGATKEQATFKILVPAAKSGIFAGIVLAIGRAIGETMAVAMIIGGSADMPNSLFQSVRTLTTNIAAGAMELQGDAHSALVATGVVLFVFSLLLNISFSCLKEISNKDKKKGKTNEK